MAVSAASSLLNEVARHVKIPLVVCDEIELAESHLDDGVTRRTVYLSLGRTERLADEVGVAYGNVEERALASGLVVSNGTFNHVSGII